MHCPFILVYIWPRHWKSLALVKLRVLSQCCSWHVQEQCIRPWRSFQFSFCLHLSCPFQRRWPVTKKIIFVTFVHSWWLLYILDSFCTGIRPWGARTCSFLPPLVVPLYLHIWRNRQISFIWPVWRAPRGWGSGSRALSCSKSPLRTVCSKPVLLSGSPGARDGWGKVVDPPNRLAKHINKQTFNKYPSSTLWI